jgi:hypothetical protein
MIPVKGTSFGRTGGRLAASIRRETSLDSSRVQRDPSLQKHLHAGIFLLLATLSEAAA